MSLVGQRIKQLRLEKGISQYRLSKLSGIAQSTISAIEAEGQTRSPAVDTLEKLAQVLKCPVSEIMGEEYGRPTSDGDGLREDIVNILIDLSPEEVQRVRDFVSGIKASRAE